MDSMTPVLVAVRVDTNISQFIMTLPQSGGL